MKNQTILRKDIIELGNVASSVPGYCLVVYKKGVFKTLVPEGSSYKPAFFEKNTLNIIGVASPSSLRSMSFKASHFHSDNVHQFSMEYYLNYTIPKTKIFADQKTQDPIKKIMEKIRHSIGNQIGKISWDHLYHADAGDFEEMKEDILNHQMKDLNKNNQSIKEVIQNYTMSLGVALGSIDFKFIIPENYVIHKKKRESTQIKKEVQQIEHEEKVLEKLNEGELKRLDAMNDASDMYYSLYEAVKTAVKNVGSSIDNPEKFLQAVKAGIEAQNMVQTKMIRLPGSQLEPGLPQGGNPGRLESGSQQAPESFQGGGQYMKFIEALREADISLGEKKIFFAKFSQLIASILEEDKEREEQLIDELIDMGLSAKLNDFIKERNKFSQEIEIILQ